MSMIKLKNVSKVYGKLPNKIIALFNINLNIEEGEFVCIKGPSRCGKSTLLNIISGLDRASDGEYFFENINITKASARDIEYIRNKNISFIFQNYSLSEHLSVWDNITLLNILLNKKVSVGKEVILKYMDMLGISSLLGKRVKYLSEEHKNRVAIAKAIANGSKIILADEPKTALDKENGIVVIETLKMLNREMNKTIIIATKDNNIANMTDRIVNMNGGLLTECKISM